MYNYIIGQLRPVKKEKMTMTNTATIIRFNPLPPPSISKHIELAPDRLDWLATYKTKDVEGEFKEYEIFIKGQVSPVKGWIKQRLSNMLGQDVIVKLIKTGEPTVEVFLPKAEL